LREMSLFILHTSLIYIYYNGSSTYCYTTYIYLYWRSMQVLFCMNFEKGVQVIIGRGFLLENYHNPSLRPKIIRHLQQ
jgi:hypothetical protein